MKLERIYHILFRNITRRKNAELALIKSEESYRALLDVLQNSRELLQATFDSNPEMIQVFKALRDEDGKIIDFVWLLNNAAAERQYGDVIGHRLTENNPGVVEAGIFAKFAEVVETGVPQQYERHYVHEQFDGWFYQSVVKLDDGVATNTINITEKHETEEKIRRMEAKQQAEIFRASLNALEEERYRISESLHNGVGQILYGIKMSLSGMTRDMEDASFEKIKKYISDLLTDAIRETRRVSHELMPKTLEEFGLNSAILEIGRQLQKITKFTCRIIGPSEMLEKYLQLAVYRTTQELMTNVVKHAEATDCTVVIVIEEERVNIQVSDNGKGVEGSKRHKPGIGLTAIRSKIKLLNGDVHIESSPESGTTVEVIIPLPEP